MSRKIKLLVCFALLLINLGGCKSNQSDIPAEQNNTPITKEDRLRGKDWTEEEVIQFYWDHKESLEQIANLLYEVDKIFDFRLSGDGYICSQHGNEFNLSDYPNCQAVLDILSGLDVVNVYYYYDDSELPLQGLDVYVRDDDISIGLCHSSTEISNPFYEHIEGNWYYFRHGNT